MKLEQQKEKSEAEAGEKKSHSSSSSLSNSTPPPPLSSTALLDVRVLLQYISALCSCLSSACRSSALLKDAISTELLKGCKISVQLVDCIAAMPGRKSIVNGGEMAIIQQEEGGELIVLTTHKGWGKQVSKLAEADIQALMDDEGEGA